MSVDRRYGGRSAEQRRAIRRTKILDAGRLLMLNEGLSKVTVKAVCAQAGLTERYFYEHFANRGALLEELFEQLADDMAVKVVAAAVMAPNDPRERVRSALGAYLDGFATDPQLRTMFVDAQNDESMLRQKAAMTRMLAELFVKIVPVVFPNAPESQIRHQLGAFFIAAGGFEITTRWAEGKFDIPRDELVDATADLLLGAMTGMFGNLEM